MGNSNNNSSGTGISTILLAVFIVLKLCGVIAWSWWWVTAPLWGGAGIAVGVILISMIIKKL